MAVYENPPINPSVRLPWHIFIILILIQLGCRASSPATQPTDTPLPLSAVTAPPTAPPAPTLPPLPTAPPTPTLTPSPTDTPTPSQTPTPTETLTPTIPPTYAILRGKVLPDRANCRYGPGWMYLYKYGLVGGSNLEIIGRTGAGDWVLIQAIGGNNPCWVKADLMDIKGDVFTVASQDVHVIFPWSPYYTPLTNVSAVRVGDTVTVSWSPLYLRAGDDADPVLYVLEAWVCHDGELVFAPDGSFEPAIEVLDEPGCAETSHARVMAAEKHGYTLPVDVPWP